MAVQDKSGGWHHSASRAQLHDEMASSKGKPASASKGSTDRQSSPSTKDKASAEPAGMMDIDNIVEKHGPAHHIEHTQGDGDVVKTTTHHQDQAHEVQHDNLHSAHLHAFHAAGKPHPEVSSGSIEDHVKEHGPAHHVTHHHDEETGTHHVTSHHGDGHEAHHSEHDSHQEAHDHMGVAMGLKSGEDETAEDKAETPETEMAETTRESGGIPGISS